MATNSIKIYSDENDWNRAMLFLKDSNFRGTMFEIPLGLNKRKGIYMTVKFTKFDGREVSSAIVVMRMEKDTITSGSCTKEESLQIPFLADKNRHNKGFGIAISDNHELIIKALERLSGERDWKIEI